MNSFLKGNFKTQKKVKTELKKSEDTKSLENQFEKEALKHLGGSIAFVSKKKVMWPEKEKGEKSKDDETGK